MEPDPAFAFNIPTANLQQQPHAHFVSQPLMQSMIPIEPMQPVQPHVMPMPSTAPWNLQSMPWPLASTSVAQPGGVMQFNAHMERMAEAQRRAQLHQKRKSELEAQMPPPKQFISEEKITAHFNGLHISSDYIQNTGSTEPNVGLMSGATDNNASISGKCFTNLTYNDYKVTARELEQKLRNATRISVCEEVKKLQEHDKNPNFLPEVLMTRIEQPCKALVLWQPPPTVELLHRKTKGELSKSTKAQQSDYSTDIDVDVAEYQEFEQETEDIDDLVDNNNTCSLDFNNFQIDSMDEDL